MNKTKQKILHTALDLYNRDGVSDVSIRHLAKEVGISHSNLIYHYSTQEDIILGLHELLLQKAVQLNMNLAENNSSLNALYQTTRTGFSVVYDFRFLFKDLQFICNAFPRVKEVIRNMERVRSVMYKEILGELMAKELIRSEEFENEFDDLIVRIKIYSDHWLESSSIYDELTKEEKLIRYSYLLIQHFYPYLTDKGKDEFKTIQKTAAR